MDGGFVLRNTLFADWQCAQLPFLSEMGKRSGNAIVLLVLLHQFLHFGPEVILEVLVRLVGFPAQAPGSVRELLREFHQLLCWCFGCWARIKVGEEEERRAWNQKPSSVKSRCSTAPITCQPLPPD